MADIALNDTDSTTGRAAAIRKIGNHDRRFYLLTVSAAIAVMAIFAGVIASLSIGAYPAFQKFGWAFFYTQAWNPVTERFGALASIYGTVVTSFLAMFLAVPVGIGIAIFLTEICPRPLRRPIGISIELLAGIPSIIYGIWGAFVLAPWLNANVQPTIIAAVAHIPLLNILFAEPDYGTSLFTGALILSIMVLPFISAVTRDVFETVPPMLKEATYGLGCTTWEVMWHVVLPFARTGVVGGAMLALGRALGETMAVTFVIGNAHHISANLFAPGTSISATIANEFAEAAQGEFYIPSLIALGLILFFITFIVLASAQLMLRALEQRAGGAHL